MKYYISFGQAHEHIVNGKVFNKDIIAVLDCVNEAQAREKAFSLFGKQWSFIYTELPDMEDFPAGLQEVF